MQDLSQITIVILAGGLGVRLRPVVCDKPKVLAEVRKRPFLTYLFDQLMAANGSRVVLCTGYMAEAIEQRFGDSYGALSLTYSKESRPLGTGGAVRQALSFIQSDPILVMNGDSYVNLDLGAYLKWFNAKERQASVLLKKVSDASRYGVVRWDESELISAFHEKNDGGAAWINVGIYIVKKSALRTIPDQVPYSLEEEFFPKLIHNGLYGYPTAGEFIDIGTPASFARAEQFFGQMNPNRSSGDPP